MKRTKRVLCMVIALSMLLTAFLSGCSSEKQAVPESTSTQSLPAESTNTEKSVEPIDLTIWGSPFPGEMPETTKNEKIKDLFNYMQAEMEKKYPGIKLTYIDKGWADTLRQNLMLATMGGNSPDVSVGEDFIPEFARIGALSELPEDMAKDMAPGPITAARYNGKLYAVAFATGIFSLVYNKDVLQKAGLTENDVPKTWNEWLDVSKKITAAGNGQFYGTIVQNNQLGGAFRMVPFIRQLGGDFTTPDWQQVTFNTPEALKALTFLRELSKTAPPGTTSLNDEGAIYEMINSGKAVFYVNGPWFISSAKNATPPANIGFAPLPVPDGGKRANVIVGNTLWYVLKQSKHQEAAVDYLRLLANSELQKKMAILQSRLPSSIEAGKDEELMKAVPEMQIFAEIVADETAAPLPVYPKNGPKIWEAWYKVQDITLVSDKPIDAALAEAQKTAEELLK